MPYLFLKQVQALAAGSTRCFPSALVDGGGVINKATGDQTLTRHLRQDAGAHSQPGGYLEEQQPVVDSAHRPPTTAPQHKVRPDPS